MTTRERLEAKVEKRAFWAEKRRAKAETEFAQGLPYRGDVAFYTQPGHIPERARVIRAADRGVEDMNIADHHEEKAVALKGYLDSTIFSDDPDALDQLTRKINKAKADQEAMKAANKAWKKDGVSGLVKLGWSQLDADKAAEKISTAYSWEKKPFPGWSLTNLNANIRRLENRVVEIKARQQRRAHAELSDCGVGIDGDKYVRITFAEKPTREILNDLRMANFLWRHGSWVGERENVPPSVLKKMQKDKARKEPTA